MVCCSTNRWGRGNMAVVVRYPIKDKPHAARIQLPDGPVFNFEIRKATRSASAIRKAEGCMTDKVANESVAIIQPIINQPIVYTGGRMIPITATGVAMQEMGKGGIDLHVPPFLPIRHNKRNVFLQGTTSRQGPYVLNRNTLHGLIVQAGIPAVNGKQMEENMAGSLSRASFFTLFGFPSHFCCRYLVECHTLAAILHLTNRREKSANLCR